MYIDIKKSGKGVPYVYITKYQKPDSYTGQSEVRLVSLGRLDRALVRLLVWQLDDSKIPKNIKNNIDQAQLAKWIDYITNRAVF